MNSTLQTDGEEAGGAEGRVRGPLTRTLAQGGRNALARVALATSELSRFDVAPQFRERLDSIHDAVCEIDGLLGEIDRLAVGPERWSGPPFRVGGAFDAVRARMKRALSARGTELAPLVDGADLTLRFSPMVFERLLCTLVRVAVASAPAAVGRWQTSVCWTQAGVRIQLSPPVGDSSWPGGETIDGELRRELEVALAEWGGSLLEADASGWNGLGFWLPREVLGV